MKKLISYLFIFIIFGAAIFAWILFSGVTNFSERNKQFVIEESKTSKQEVIYTLQQNNIIKHSIAIGYIGDVLGIWSKIKPGKYEAKQGENLLSIVRMLKNGSQISIKLVINKLRTKQDFSKLVSKNFAVDSISVMNYLTNPDSLKQFKVDTNSVFTMIFPDTYSFYWNTSLSKILTKLNEAKEKFWNKNDRINKAKALGFSPEEIYTLASIIEEETNHDSDRSKIASVYINRIKIGMPLQACPTIKFAMKNFILTRIYEKYLFYPSPYNTYRNKGLPPGPICTPSPKCIDLVLDAPKTDYLFFVAHANFDGYHHFSSNFAEHNKYAKEYQKALDIYMANKANKQE